LCDCARVRLVKLLAAIIKLIDELERGRTVSIMTGRAIFLGSLLCLTLALDAGSLEVVPNETSRNTISIGGEIVLARVGFNVQLPKGIRTNHFDDWRKQEGNVIRIGNKLGEPTKMAANYLGVKQRIEVHGSGLQSDFRLIINGVLPLVHLGFGGQIPISGNAGRGIWFAIYPDRSRFEWGVFPETFGKGGLFAAESPDLPQALGYVTGSGKGIKLTLSGDLWKKVYITDVRSWGNAFAVGAYIADQPLPEGTELKGSYGIEELRPEDLKAHTGEYEKIAWQLGIDGTGGAAPTPVAKGVRAVCPRALQSPTIDGDLNDACWANAAVLAPFIRDTDLGLPKEATVAYTVHDGKNLCLAFVCHESSMGNLVSRNCTADESGMPWEDDCVEIFIDPRGETTNHDFIPYYHFILTADGEKTDIEHQPPAWKQNWKWASGWNTATVRKQDRWIAEVSIPLDKVTLGQESLPGELIVNVAREEKPSRENSSWPGVTGRMSFHNRPLFGRLILDEALPWVTEVQMDLPRPGQNELSFRTGGHGEGRVVVEVSVAGKTTTTEAGWREAGGRVSYGLPSEGTCTVSFAVTAGDETIYRSATHTSPPLSTDRAGKGTYGDGKPYQPFPPEEVEPGPFASDQTKMVPFSLAPLTEDISGTPLDFSFLVDAPAGKHGFVTVKDGHLTFEDGTRARFWGTAFITKSCFMPHSMAENMARHLAAMGLNIVSLGGFDGPVAYYEGSRASIVDGKWGAYHSENWDLLDYFIYQLKKNGIYVHLLPGNYVYLKGHPGIVREAGESDHHLAGAAVFDPKMIELQKEYASILFNHKNPYTGLAYKDDPVFATVQTVDEWLVWSYAGFTPHYLNELKALWNTWLLEKYGDREKVKTAWTDRDGNCALMEGQDPAAGTVPLPDLAGAKTWDRPYVAEMYRTAEEVPNLVEWFVKYRSRMAVNSIPCVNDASRFCFETQVRFETGMREHLRAIGVKVPIQGSGVNGRMPGALRAASEMDFVDAHPYWDWGRLTREALTSRNRPMAKDDPFDFARNQIADIGVLAAQRVRGKPLLSAGWAHAWPDEYRAESYFFMSAYACLQDWDTLCRFAYTDQNNWHTKKLKWQAAVPDPAGAGVLRFGSLLFHRQDVRPALTEVAVGFSETDTHYHQSWGVDGNRLCPADWLVAVSRVGNEFFDRNYEGDAEVVIASGRSSSACYTKAKHAIVFADNPWQDLYHKEEPDLTSPLRDVSPGVTFEKDVEETWSFRNVLTIDETVQGSARLAMRLDSLPKGAVPFGISGSKALCLGYVDRRFCLVSDVRLGVGMSPDFLYRVYAAAARHWKLPGAENLVPHEFISDTEELRWDFRSGVLTINTDRSQGAVGFLKSRDVDLKHLDIRDVENEFSCLMLSSLDGECLDKSSHMLLLAVGKAENTGQHWSDRERTQVPRRSASTPGGYGEYPVLIEPITAHITLETELAVGKMEIHALDGAGKRVKDVKVVAEEGRRSFDIGAEYRTIYYEICSGD